MRSSIRISLSTVCALTLCHGAGFGLAQAGTISAKALALITAVSSDCQNFDAGRIESYTFTDPTQNGSSGGKYTLYEVPCSLAAYNSSQRWFLKNQYDDISPLSFATPVITSTYVDPDEMRQLKSVSVTSYTARGELSNSGFDAQFRSISASHKWRGLGDAGEGGTWRFEGGEFMLESYEIDPTFDGEINIKTVWSQGRASN